MVYKHAILDDINVSRLLDLKWIKDSWPYNKSVFFDKYKSPAVVYKYPPPLGVQVFNYKNIVNHLDYFTKQSCDCENSPFRDVKYNHICTGDLDIINDGELRDLFKKGCNYRIRPILDILGIEQDLLDAIDGYLPQIAHKYRMDQMDFVPWATELHREVLLRLDRLNNRIYPPDMDIHSNAEFKRLRNHFVITPIDKASNNFAFICKKFYATTLLGELNSNTYGTTDWNNHDTVKMLIDGTNKLGVQSNSTDIPFPYIIPKKHKSELKFRTIISGKSAITKRLSYLIGLALKVIVKNALVSDDLFKKYKHSCNSCWIINDNQPILQWIKEINRRNKAKEIRTYDFENLYTTLPHKKLVSRISSTIDRVLKNDCFINVSKYHSYICLLYTSDAADD